MAINMAYKLLQLLKTKIFLYIRDRLAAPITMGQEGYQNLQKKDQQ